MSELQVIHNQEILGHNLSVYGTFENPLFLAKDVAGWIEHSRASEMLKSIDEDEKLMQTILASGQKREMWFLTEDGVYEVLMQSRKPIAKQFKKKVKAILKEIRIDGGYIATNEDDDESMIMAKAIMIANKKIERQKRENEALHQQIEVDAPYTNFGKIVAISDGAINLGVYAKIIYEKHGIDLGRNKLFGWLRDNGYLIKQKGAEQNFPKQYYIEKGWFRVRPAVVTRTDGNMQTGTTLITGKGQIALTQILLDEFNPVAKTGDE